MTMHNPPHPGEFIKEVYLDELNICESVLAEKLKVSLSALHTLISGQSALTPEMALRLSKTLGRTPESWLAIQDKYGIWLAGKTINLDEVERLEIPA